MERSHDQVDWSTRRHAPQTVAEVIFPRAGRLAVTAEVPPTTENLRATKDLLFSADFVAEVGCREPRTVIHRARCDAAAGAGDDGAAQTRPGAAVLFVLP